MTSPRLQGIVLVLADAVLFTLITIVALWLRGLSFYDDYVFAMATTPMILAIGALYLIDGYDRDADMLSSEYTSQHLISVGLALCAALLLTFVFSASASALHASRLVITVTFAVFAFASLLVRRIMRLRIVQRQRERALVFIGKTEDWVRFRDNCTLHQMGHPLFFAKADSGGELEVGEAHVAHLLEEIETGSMQVEAIIVQDTERAMSKPVADRLVRCFFKGVPAYTLDLFEQVYWQKITLDRLGHTSLFEEGFNLARDPVFEHLKRIADVTLSLVGIALSLPLLTAATLAIWIDDRGPVFFAQTRIGRHQVPFRMFKLRTMRVVRDTANSDPYTRTNDPRITRVGNFLRKSRIDELPQLFNVLRGDMSIIGPRAEWDRLVETYQTQITHYHFRHLVKPGITGWAQVNYPYGSNLTDTIRKLEYDLYYIRHYSLGLDASIILKTLHTMLLGKGK